MRNYRLPLKFCDTPPGPSIGSQSSIPTPVVRRVILHVRDSFRTAVDQFGVLREYLHRPSYDPDAYVKAEDLADFTTDASIASPDPPLEQPGYSHLPPWPFGNMSTYLLMNWQNTGSSQKTEHELNRLVKEVIGNPQFQSEDLRDFNAHREHKRLDNAKAYEQSPTPFAGDDWQEVSIELTIPIPERNVPPRSFFVPGLHHRSIIEVIKATWGAASSLPFHLTPFRRIHVDPKTGHETRIFDEVYTSEAFELEHDLLQKQQPEPGCRLERVIAGLMFWSDVTHPTNFGTVKLWPVYMCFANLSKYVRAKPNSGACHHLAYIPSVCCLSTAILSVNILFHKGS
jgi:hypothetical protein